MSFVGLILHNLSARKVRTALTAFAVAVGVMTVVTLGVVTHSLRTTAAAVLKTGKADFTVAQKGVSDVTNSVIDDAQIQRLSRYPGVASTVGTLLAFVRLDADNPLFLEIGLAPDRLAEFGVQVVTGQSFAATATDEVMLGWRAADSLGKRLGDRIVIDGNPYRVVGIYETGQSFGDSGSMLPLVTLQANERKAGNVTLAFMRVTPGTSVRALRHRIEHDNPTLTTIRFATEFGRVDRNLQFLDAAETGATILALVIGTVIVMNTMLLSFFERTREFGVMRAIGWARLRIVTLVVGEALLISLFGAATGVGLSFAVTRVLERTPALLGILHADFTAGIFWQALYTAAGIGLLAAIYPAIRAARLEPLAALRRE